MKFYFSKPEQFAVGILLMAILGALVVLGYAYGSNRQQRQQAPLWTPPPPVAAATPKAEEETPAASSGQELAVHVTGAVQKPGVYHFHDGARLDDAIKAARAKSDADPDALNLAARLLDGEKIIVPTHAEAQRQAALASKPLVQEDAHTPPPGNVLSVSTPPATTASSHPAAKPAKEKGSSSSRKELPTSPIDINTAGLDELQKLPGIGAAMAQRILDYRAAHGKFTDLADLRNVSGIGEKKLAKLTPYVKL